MWQQVDILNNKTKQANIKKNKKGGKCGDERRVGRKISQAAQAAAQSLERSIIFLRNTDAEGMTQETSLRGE